MLYRLKEKEKKPGCRWQHNVLAHDELSERIISPPPQSEKGGGRRSAALNPRKVGGRQIKEEKHTEERGEKSRKCPLRPGGSIQSTDVGTLL